MKDRVSRLWIALLLGAGVGLTGACSPSAEMSVGEARSAEPSPTLGPEELAGEASPAASTGPLMVFLGDSLTAGLGVGEGDAFPEQVRLRLAAEGVAVRVVNAGVSGDTTAGGLARLAWVLRQEPEILVVGLGANDGLRGLAPEDTEANLRAIVEEAHRTGANVLLLGMMLPPNYGPDYTDAFEQIFPRLARELETPLVPFLLTDVAGVPELNQADGIHPTAEGHSLMADNVLPPLRAMLAGLPTIRG
jgi:acyl-CoA thioesterase-1